MATILEPESESSLNSSVNTRTASVRLRENFSASGCSSNGWARRRRLAQIRRAKRQSRSVPTRRRYLPVSDSLMLSTMRGKA